MVYLSQALEYGQDHETIDYCDVLSTLYLLDCLSISADVRTIDPVSPLTILIWLI